MILRMRPKKKAKTAVGEMAEKKVERQSKFPGLALPDTKVTWSPCNPPPKKKAD